MTKHKKHMKLPNGYGSIKYLGANRRRPYAVYPPVTRYALNGTPIRDQAIGYAENWNAAYELLIAWKNGFMLSAAQNPTGSRRKGPTFAEIYERFYTDKYVSSQKTYSQASQYSTRAAFSNCAALHDRNFRSLRYEDLQSVVDACPLKHSSLELIVNLFKQMYQYALKYDLTDKDYSQWIEIRKPEDDEHGIPFSDEELTALWAHSDNDTIALLLIMIYSGFRIGEWKAMKINLDEGYFQGGIKTAAGKNRIVPIYSGIRCFVVRLLEAAPELMPCSPAVYRKRLYAELQTLGISNHTPHDSRHTFSALCERYGVSENDRKRMLGHSFSDVTNKVYGHRTLEDLRKEIEKIQRPAA